MYLTHQHVDEVVPSDAHSYLIDLVAGGALAVGFFSCMMTEDLRHLPGATHATTYVQYSFDQQSSNAPPVLKRWITAAQLECGLAPSTYGNGIDPAATALLPNAAEEFELRSEHGDEDTETTPALPIVTPQHGHDLESGRRESSRPSTPAIVRARSPKPNEA